MRPQRLRILRDLRFADSTVTGRVSCEYHPIHTKIWIGAGTKFEKRGTMSNLDRVWIQSHIYVLRSQKVMLSSDLAQLYSVEPKVLIQAVKRNIDRFPEDFMFQLSLDEYLNLKSQIVTSSWGGSRSPPYAFTEQGIAMLSSALRSPVAIQINIEIMREFVAIRRFLISHHELSLRLTRLEEKYDKQFKAVFDAIRLFTMPPEKPKRRIGILSDEDDDK